MTNESYIRTSHGVLAIEKSGGGNLPVVLIHGNSSCRHVFRDQLESELFNNCRFIAVDLRVTASPKTPLMPMRPTRCLAWQQLYLSCSRLSK